MKSDLASVSQRVDNLTEEVLKLETGLNTLNNSVTHDFSGFESGLNSTANKICDNINKLPIYTCGGTGGWRRAVYLDMTDHNTNCPSGWQLTGYSKRTCGRVSSGPRTCDSVFFPVSGGPYTRVCGRIRAYQYGVPLAFWGYNVDRQTIDSAYVSGVAVMHGSPRQHIWTFANGAWENATEPRTYNCPCDISGGVSIPPFVGEGV